MSKEEIIKKCVTDFICFGAVQEWVNIKIKNAMDEYAKQEAISFSEYCGSYGEYHKGEWRGNVMKAEPIYTTSELYEKYLKEKQ